jgi:hypothetical protein
VDREELKRLTEEEVGRRIREGVKAVIEQVLEGGDAKGHGGLGFPVLPGHGPALGRGRETHKNRDLTRGHTSLLPLFLARSRGRVNIYV